jgi:hypothetical protein
MFPFPQTPFGGTGGMTANQVPQPMQGGMQQSPMQQMVPSPMMPQGGGMGLQGGLQQPMPQQAQGIDPQQLARLRAMLMQQQQMGGAQMPTNNLRAMLGL